MSDPLQRNFMIDLRLEAYGTIFNHAWAKSLMETVDGTKLDPPAFELTINWRAAVNTHGFPWMMMKSMAGLWEGGLKDRGFTPQFVRAMATEIPKRMGSKMTHTARQRLGQVIQELADQIHKALEEDPTVKMTAEDFWQQFLDKQLWEFHVAIWGSQRFCFGALYHAYENYFREVLAIKKDNPNYRFLRFPQLVDDTTAEFGADIADKCLKGEFLDISRWVRNSLAHNGGKENKDLKEYRKTTDHGIPVVDEFLQIMAPDNKLLLSALQKRVTILTEEALKHPQCR